MTALDGEHDPLLAALRSALFDSLQDTTLLGFSPRALRDGQCHLLHLGVQKIIIDRWCWVGKNATYMVELERR